MVIFLFFGSGEIQRWAEETHVRDVEIPVRKQATSEETESCTDRHDRDQSEARGIAVVFSNGYINRAFTGEKFVEIKL